MELHRRLSAQTRGAQLRPTNGASFAPNVPGPRDGSAGCVGPNGNFWLFGGSGIDSASGLGDLDDLWKLNPSTRQWSWESGSDKVKQKGTYGTLGQAAAANVPGVRHGAVCWSDPSGHIWLFGGYGYLNDFPVEKYWRDARVLSIYEGTNEIQRLVIGQALEG